MDGRGDWWAADSGRAGRETARHIGDLLTLSNAYDPLGSLTAQQLIGRDGRRVVHRAYTYRPDGYPTAIEDLEGTKRFDLDTAGRVTGVRAADWTERYAYDQAGNQIEVVLPLSPGSTAA